MYGVAVRKGTLISVGEAPSIKNSLTKVSPFSSGCFYMALHATVQGLFNCSRLYGERTYYDKKIQKQEDQQGQSGGSDNHAQSNLH